MPPSSADSRVPRSSRTGPYGTVPAVAGPTGVGARLGRHARGGWAAMTDLLTAVSTRITPQRGAAPAAARPLWLSAGLAGLTGAGTVLLGCMALGLVGWFSSDAGTH